MNNVIELFIKDLKKKLLIEIQTRLRHERKSKIKIISEIIKEKYGKGNSFLVEICVDYIGAYGLIGNQQVIVKFIINENAKLNSLIANKRGIRTEIYPFTDNPPFLPPIQWERATNENPLKINQVCAKMSAYLRPLIT